MLGNLFGSKKLEPAPIAPSVSPVAIGQPSLVVPSPVISASASNVADANAASPSTKHDMSVLTHLDSRAALVISHAEQEAKRIQQATIEPDQLLLGLLYDGEIFQLFEQFSLNVAKISQELQSKEKSGNATTQPTLSENSKKIIEQSYMIAKNHSGEFVSPEDILLALYSDGVATEMATYLQSQGLKKEDLSTKLEKSGVTAGKKSILDKYGTDLTEQARKGELDPIAGRDRETERLVHILLRRTKNNPVIIGEAGTGKTAIVEGLAELIASGKIPRDLQNKRIVQLDLSSLIAGASHRGEFEERLKEVIKEAQASNGTVILFIDEIHTLIGAGDTQGALDASNIIKPYLARGQLQMIGTTTTAEFRKYFEKDKAFERRFQQVVCEEPDEDVAVEMLKVLQGKYEKFHHVTYPEETLKAAVHLSKKYIGERYLPDKAVDLLDEGAAEVKLQHDTGKRSDAIVTPGDIENVVSSWTGIPITKLTEDEGQKLLHMEDFIHKRLIDQVEAVTAVAEAVRRGRIGLAAANRPIASFIFLGPTGVGKTELAKALAEIMFGKEEATVRLDMSEYMEKHEVAKLIGAPPGYVGYEEGGQLTEAVRKKPYSIVLFDEVEKAHPDVFNILLQLLEDGRLTDNKGNTISFKNTIIICTSNIGSALIQQQLLKNIEATGDAPETPEGEAVKFADLHKLLTGELQKFFRPELLNRFDEVVMFKPLARSDMAGIAKLGIQKTEKLLKEQGYSLQITEGALQELAAEGYDPLYGARPLRRLVQTAIENPIAIQLISKVFVPGDTILIDYDKTKSEFVFTKTQPQPTPGSVADSSHPGEATTSIGSPSDSIASLQNDNGNNSAVPIAVEPVVSAPPVSEAPTLSAEQSPPPDGVSSGQSLGSAPVPASNGVAMSTQAS